jgi:hypothetical protein
MPELQPDVERELASMSDEDFDVLVARVRPPVPRRGEGGRAEAAKRFPMGPSIPPSDRHPKSNGANGAAEADRRYRQKEQ